MIQVITRALNIIEYVAQHGKEPVQLIKIAENMGLSQPTTANIVKTLTSKNYLEQVARKTGYRLGSAAFALAGNQSHDQDLIVACKQPLEELTTQLNETSLLAVIRNQMRLILHAVDCNQDLTVRPKKTAEVYQAATGRVLLAFLPEKELQHLVKAIGLPPTQVWPGAETREGLQEALKDIREKGYATLLTPNHVIGFAIPVYLNKKVIASISLYLPEIRYEPAKKEKILRRLKKTAKAIQDNLQKKA
jgi:DNA-binding IclR family transcriptional regulator